jgi:hypothetical protein
LHDNPASRSGQHDSDQCQKYGDTPLCSRYPLYLSLTLFACFVVVPPAGLKVVSPIGAQQSMKVRPFFDVLIRSTP